MAIRRGIGAKLFLAFSATAIPVLLAAGLLLEWQARRALDRELARRVEAMAVSIGTSIPAETWQFALSLGAGEQDSRTARHLRGRLEAVRAATGAERIELWDLEGRLILDSHGALPLGVPAPRAALVAEEMELVRQGRTATTPLYRAMSGRWMKIGLAPVPPPSADASAASGGSPRGVLIVEAPSASLAAVQGMRRTLAVTGLAALLLVLAVALGLSRALTARIQRLAQHARSMESGELSEPVPLHGRDEIAGLAGALESMRQAVQSREHELRAMLGGVAHEIRNPLGGLLLYAEMLARSSSLAPEERERAGRILAEAIRLEKVVGDFLAYARPETPAGERVTLEPAIAECVEGVRASLDWSGTLDVELEAAHAWSDGVHFRQIVHNLLRNAMQAAGPDGRVRVRSVRLPAPAAGQTGELGENLGTVLAFRGVGRSGPGAEPSPARGIVLTVEDSGKGIPDEERERVFDAFHTARAQGAGLGLAVVKRLCSLNGIGIAIGRSALGGALFALTLPAETEDR